jgi:CHASE3 domain sensor protein
METIFIGTVALAGLMVGMFLFDLNESKKAEAKARAEARKRDRAIKDTKKVKRILKVKKVK